MRTSRRAALTVLVSAGLCCCWGCGKDRAKKPPPQARPARPAGAQPRWTATKLTVIDKMNAPESVLVDPATGAAYVSNMETDKGQYWGEDGTGFVSRLKPGGELDVLRWKESSARLRLHCPKGMCMFGGSVHVADDTRVVRFAVDSAGASGTVKGIRGKRLNDMATDGRAVYVSDTGAGKIYKTDGVLVEEVKAPPAVNGITFFKDKMFAVSWDLHDVYELDRAGKKEPKPFGVAEHFQSLDAIEVLDDGTFIVTDCTGGKVCTISPDRKTVRTLATLEKK